MRLHETHDDRARDHDDDTAHRADSTLHARTSICKLAPLNSICALPANAPPTLARPTAEHPMRRVPTRGHECSPPPIGALRRRGVIARTPASVDDLRRRGVITRTPASVDDLRARARLLTRNLRMEP